MLTKLYILSIYILIFLCGLAVGSFLNVLVWRVPRTESIVLPPSHCTSCGERLRWYDNIPILSYIILGGKCRFCKEKISLRYPLIELLNAVLWVISALIFKDAPIYALVSATSASILIAIAFIDLEFMLIFNRFSLSLAALGIISMHFDGYTVWYDHLIGLGAAALLFFGVYYIFLALVGREGMGLGDVKLACAAGLLLGWQKFLVALILSSVIASIVLLLVRKCRGDSREKEYPFGPFLALGICFSMLFGAELIGIYTNALFTIIY